MSDKLSVGFIGTGNIARSHMEAIKALEQIEIAAVMDVDMNRAQAAAEEYGGRACAGLDELLADESVQAVHVCTPHNQHVDQVVAAAQAGKHVLVEKPMALTLAGCDRMIAASKEAGKLLMVGQVLRYWPIYRKVREMVRAGKIGAVGHQMRRRYSRFNPGEGHWYLDPEEGGNCVLHAFGPHEYDVLHWMIDSPVAQVYARGTESAERLAGQCDSYSALMTHANGAVSMLSQTVSCHSGAWDQHVVGSLGSMFITSQKLMVDGEEVEVEGVAADGMRNQVAEFADCCLKRETPDASGESVRHTMAMIEAVQLSSARGEVVELAELDPEE
ncbi:MAG: Gfo/Idh/MocA family oxidoreductase [Gemmatimonadetes bacterium]|nr:Gfo/Idh/MocA family oxidoreductase [Gemmatimonadota bacterium]